MKKRYDEGSFFWLANLHRAIFAGSLISAVVAFVVEGYKFPIGSLCLLVCVVAIGYWCFSRKPSLYLTTGIVVAASIALGWTSAEPESALFQLVLIAAVVGWRVDRLEPSLLLLHLLVLAPPIGNLGTTDDNDWGWWNWCMGILIIWSFGYVIQQLEDTLSELTDARSQLIDGVVRKERLRISRDVHDMVGHSLTALLLNVRAARRALEMNTLDRSEAERALIDAEKIGVDGIADIRAIWIDLRDESFNESDAGELLSSVPDGEAVLHLISRHNHITSTVSGNVAALSGPVALSIYRVLQECITNIIKHASVSTATITLDVKLQEVLLTATNRLQCERVAADPVNENAIGLISMRERITSLGGTFEAGVNGEEWQIRCRIPHRG